MIVSSAAADGDVPCGVCSTRESTYWRRGPDGPKTLCNSCGLNWFRQRPMQREQVEKGNLMAAAVAAAALKRPANSLKEGPEKRKREEKKDGKQLREQLHGPKGAESKQLPGAKRRKVDSGTRAAKQERAGGQVVASGLKGLQRSEKGSIRRKLGDAAVKKAALIKRTPSQLSLVGLLESAAAAPVAPQELPPAAAVKPTGVLKGARFSPLKQAQTRLGAQKLLAVLNVIKQKKGLGRVISTASLESVPEEDPLDAQPDEDPGTSRSGVPAGSQVLSLTLESPGGGWELGAAGDSVRRPATTGARSQRRPNTALLQGASFLPWKARPRGWESSSLTFAAAESRLLKTQAAASAARGRSSLQTRAEAGPPGAGPEPEAVAGKQRGTGRMGPALDAQQRGRPREGGVPEPGSPERGEAGSDGDDADGFAGYGVLRKLLEEVEAPPTSPPGKGRPPLSRRGGAPPAKKPQRLEQAPGPEGPPARPVLSSYESFEDLVMGTAGGMKRFESFEDLALRAGPVFARVESFEELALRAGPAMRRFESFEDLAMRSQPVVEPPPRPAPQPLPATHGGGRGDGESSAEQGSEGESGSREGAGRRSGREKKQKTWEWAVVDGPKRRRKDARDEKGLLQEGVDGQGPWLSGAAQGQPVGGQAGQAGRGLQPPQGSQGRGGGGTQQSPGMLGSGGPSMAGSVELGQPGQGKEEPAMPDGQSGPAEGHLRVVGVLPQQPAAATAGQPGASLPRNGLRHVVQLPGSTGPPAPLARSVVGLGPRGVSARALHLLVDCAMEPEPAAGVATLMADLQTLAIGSADQRGENDGGQEKGRGLDGAAGGLKEGFTASFTLPNGRSAKQVATVADAIRPPARGESDGDGAAPGRAETDPAEGGASATGEPGGGQAGRHHRSAAEGASRMRLGLQVSAQLW